MKPRAAVAETAEPRAVVSWEGPGEPIVLALYGPAGEVAVPMVPKQALTLAQELLTRGVQAWLETATHPDVSTRDFRGRALYFAERMIGGPFRPDGSVG